MLHSLQKPHDLPRNKYAVPSDYYLEADFSDGFGPEYNKVLVRSLQVYTDQGEIEKILRLLCYGNGAKFHKSAEMTILDCRVLASIDSSSTDESSSLFSSTMTTHTSDSCDLKPIDKKLDGLVSLRSCKFTELDNDEKVSVRLEESVNENAIKSVFVYFEVQSKIYSDKMVGLYSVVYQKDEKQHYYAVSQFESNHFSKLSPTVDQPEVKSKFQVTIILPPDSPAELTAFSNTERDDEYNCGSNTFVFKPLDFATSPYLIAMLIGEFKQVPFKTLHEEFGEFVPKFKDGKPYEVNAIIPISCKEYEDKIQYLIKCGYLALLALNVLKIPYKLRRMDLAAIHKFGAGAMENWGLITFRISAALTLDPENSTKESISRNFKEIATVLAHEVSHNINGGFLTMLGFHNLAVSESANSACEILLLQCMLFIQQFLNQKNAQSIFTHHSSATLSSTSPTSFDSESELRNFVKNQLSKLTPDAYEDYMIEKVSGMLSPGVRTPLGTSKRLSSRDQALLFNSVLYSLGPVSFLGLFLKRSIKKSFQDNKGPANAFYELFNFYLELGERNKPCTIDAKDYFYQILACEPIQSEPMKKDRKRYWQYIDGLMENVPTVTIVEQFKFYGKTYVRHAEGFEDRITLIFISEGHEVVDSKFLNNEDIRLEPGQQITSVFGVYAVKYDYQSLVDIFDSKNLMQKELALEYVRYIFNEGLYGNLVDIWLKLCNQENAKKAVHYIAEMLEKSLVKYDLGKLLTDSQVAAQSSTSSSQSSQELGKILLKSPEVLEKIRIASGVHCDENEFRANMSKLVSSITEFQSNYPNRELPTDVLIKTGPSLSTSDMCSYYLNLFMVIPHMAYDFAEILNESNNEKLVQAILKLPIIDLSTLFIYAAQLTFDNEPLREWLKKMASKNLNFEYIKADVLRVLDANAKKEDLLNDWRKIQDELAQTTTPTTVEPTTPTCLKTEVPNPLELEFVITTFIVNSEPTVI